MYELNELLVFGLIALSAAVHYLFLNLSWAKQYDRALVPGIFAFVAWWITAGVWFAETVATSAIWAVAFLWFALGIVAGVQFVIVGFTMYGKAVKIQDEED